MNIICKPLSLCLASFLLFALAGCGGVPHTHNGEAVQRGFPPDYSNRPEELLHFSWKCERMTNPGPYSVSLVVHGSGDLTGTLGDVQLSGGGASPDAPAGGCQVIATEAVSIARGQACYTREPVFRTTGNGEIAVFGATCLGTRFKLVQVMGQLMQHASTFSL